MEIIKKFNADGYEYRLHKDEKRLVLVQIGRSSIDCGKRKPDVDKGILDKEARKFGFSSEDPIDYIGNGVIAITNDKGIAKNWSDANAMAFADSQGFED